MELNRTFHEEIGPYFLVLASDFLATGSKVCEPIVVYTIQFEQSDIRYQVFCVRNYTWLLIIETPLQKLK